MYLANAKGKSKKRSERLTEVLRKLDEVDKLYNRDTDLTIAERYIEHSLEIVCEWNVTTLSGYSIDFVTIFDRALGASRVEGERYGHCG